MIISKLALVAVLLSLSIAASADESQFKLALINHAGQLSWSANGYKVVQSSAKPNGNEIGIRGTNGSGTTFLGFLFLFPEKAPLTSSKCRDGVLDSEMRTNPSLKIQSTLETTGSGGPPVALVNYTAQDRGGKTVYVVRGFVAVSDILRRSGVL